MTDTEILDVLERLLQDEQTLLIEPCNGGVSISGDPGKFRAWSGIPGGIREAIESWQLKKRL